MTANSWWSRKLGGVGAPQPPRPPQQLQPPAPSTHSYDAKTGMLTEDDGFMERIAQAAASTGGSRAMREGSGTCPECGSGNYFNRALTESGMAARIPAAARCYDCGYPIIQAGSSHGSASALRSAGPAQRARQLPAGHEVTVVGEGGRSQTYRHR